jgi:hypothetical protein
VDQVLLVFIAYLGVEVMNDMVAVVKGALVVGTVDAVVGKAVVGGGGCTINEYVLRPALTVHDTHDMEPTLPQRV